MILGKIILEKHKILEVEIEIIMIEMTTLEEVKVGLGKDNIQVILEGMAENSRSRSKSGSRASTNRDRIRCFKCKEYDHFAKDCLNTQTEKEPEQIQLMYNFDEEQTALKVFATDMYDNLIRKNSDDAIVDHLNL